MLKGKSSALLRVLDGCRQDIAIMALLDSAVFILVSSGQCADSVAALDAIAKIVRDTRAGELAGKG